jgi:armadillo repeat-containing protein 8
MAAVDISDLRSAPDPGTIRRFRTQLIGKQTLKESSIQAGILPLLSEILTQYENEDPRSASAYSESLYAEIASLVSVLAHEGASYVLPILKSEILELLLQRLVYGSSLRDALAILKCLNTVASELPSRVSGEWEQDKTLADLLYSSQYIGCIVRGIRSACDSSASSQLCDLTVGLLCRTCTTEEQKSALADHHILEALALKLASVVVAQGNVAPSLSAIDFPDSSASSLPSPASVHAHLSPILEAIALVLENSAERARLFFSISELEAVLPRTKDMSTPNNARQAPWAGSTGASTQSRHAIETYLPTIPIRPHAAAASNVNFPPLGAGAFQRRRSSFHPTPPQAASSIFDNQNQAAEEEVGLVPYLLVLACESRGRRRLVACKLLAVLQDLGLVHKSRRRMFGSLLVPLLVRMLDIDEPAARDGLANAGSYLSDGSYYSKAAPSVLGMLIIDDPDFQKMAVECKAILKLSSNLKKSFDVVPSQKSVQWKPYKSANVDMHTLPGDCTLGSTGPSDTVRQHMRHRKAILQALAAIAPDVDEYRQDICKQGVLPLIIKATDPFKLDQDPVTKMSSVCGNAPSTVVAACGCVRALTRSVKALRTKLVDAEVAKRIIMLISSTDPEVTIAATQVLTNLAMDFSPVKDEMDMTHITTRLCLQAHSAHARLRYESLWTLKQLAVNESKELKMKIVKELSCKFIRELICTDPNDVRPGEVIGLGTTQRSGEDVDMSDVEPLDPPDWFGLQNPFPQHTVEEDYLIQEQMFDLLRNLFCGNSAADIVEYVLKHIGHREFFEALRKRLSTRRDYGATRRDNVDSPPRAGLVSTVLYNVIHIAASSQTWRHAIIAETGLMKAILGLISHSEAEVRAGVCWLAINLMYEDDSSDKAFCQQRARELIKQGYRDRILRLENDPDLNVRERAKAAMYLFGALLEP